MTKIAIDQWASAAGISSGMVFRSMNNRGQLAGKPLLAQNIMEAGPQIRPPLARPRLHRHHRKNTSDPYRRGPHSSAADKAAFSSTRRVLEKPTVRFLANGSVAIINGIEIRWVTIPPDIIVTTDDVTWYDIKGSMLGIQLNTVKIPVQGPSTPPSNSDEPH